jgi:hypothetical protein
MSDRYTGRREAIRKFIPCSCGKEAKLIQRRNYPHGRKSGAVVMRAYRCASCQKLYPLIKPKEVRK